MARTTRLAGCVRRGRPLLVLLVVVLLGALTAASAAARELGRAAPQAIETKAPKITHQPASVTAEEGQSASFEATASGVPAPSVQWEVSSDGGSSFHPIPEATSNTLTIASTKTSESGDQFRAVFTNSAGAATGKAATLTVQLKPTVSKQPTGATVEEGETANFEASASAFPAPSVQWELSTDAGSTWKPVKNATADRLTVTDALTSENGDEYRAVFKNVAGQATSAPATLTVRNAPKVTEQPVNTTTEEGFAASFYAAASGFPTPAVRWELSTNHGVTFTTVEGATTGLLRIESAKASETGDEYRAVFTNAAGAVTTNTATLTVQDRPVITEQPVSATVEVGHSASFEAQASGVPTPSVQWELSSDGGKTFAPIKGATADQLTIAETSVTESGDELRAAFKNAVGQVDTADAILTVAAHHYRVLAWGQNSFGQLGDGNFSVSDAPVPVTGLNFVTAVAAGRRDSFALLSDGTVMAWGDDASGQLGDGENRTSDVPERVEGLSGVEAIAAGSNFTLALLSDGTVMAWGAGENGQLGDGATEETNVPVPVKGLTGVTAVAAGGEHALALLSDGEVMAWGENEHGELGNGTEKNEDAPVAVKGLSGVAAIAAGGEHSLALLNSGTVEAWGSDRYGQLANPAIWEAAEEENAEAGSDVPVPVAGLSGVSAISAGTSFNLALLSGGTVMAWGEDASGELGDGEAVQRQETPVAVSGLADVTSVSAGGEHSMALLANGTVTTWGEDKFGELGDGTSGEPSDVPVIVGALGEVAGIAAGGVHDLAESEPVPSISAVNPAEGGTAGGASVTITGANLAGATAVHFGANSAERFEITSPGSITAIAPAGSLGTVDITVTTPAGTSAHVAADRFSYVSSPTVSALSVKSGPGGGETTVTITGREFTEATAVAFGGVAAERFVVNSATSITAVSPPGAGTVDVTVTAAGGASAASKHDQFEYVPAVEHITPGSGPLAGGTRVTISGQGFAEGAGATTFKIGKKAATEVVCTSHTACTATTPAAKKAGSVEAIAQVGKAKSPSAPPGDSFTYE